MGKTERRLFGTDGIRGIANAPPMTPETVLRVGKAVADVFKKQNGRTHKVVIGKDTRLSGYMIETALTSGLVSMGVEVMLVGPLPTPAIAHLTKSLNADAGIVLSASHNPASHNGTKIFDSKGFKLSDAVELEIERVVFSGKELGNNNSIGKAFRVNEAKGRYIEYVKGTVDNTSLKGFKIVVDCANGAAYNVVPAVFSELGVEVKAINVFPDGLNINLNCGALHPEGMQRAVKETGANVGFAFDGDADRVIACNEKGELLDGDQIMALCAKKLLDDGKLKKKTVVATVMSNLGFHEAMRKEGINVRTTAVGDRYVIEEMKSNSFNFGGEQSGHIIFGDYSTTGDGLITALQLLRIMKETRKPLSELSGLMNRFPQVLINVNVREKKPFEMMPAVSMAVKDAESVLGKNGRVLLRYSGTENIARVMLEGKNEKLINSLASKIVASIKKEIGA
ncbi:MAG: phosphoglucosamine mutase [Candidatus Diapherotrites archaeon]|uniref:Phosphoglucosamine mutase n=1 Tax=Candidatus Iainarchaeum sp. TaxID=3101447 RepID=A0A8T4L0L7_9ARCH|nr:phosphoglucosamine mutase [Candidatus Diapherotrites archaeon]